MSLCIIPFLCKYSNPNNNCLVYVLITWLKGICISLAFNILAKHKIDMQELTASGKDPNFPKSDDIDPPGTNSNRMFKVSSSLTVPKYL